MFIFLAKKIGRKDTIKVFVVYLVLGGLFALGQLAGMENAWVVILPSIIIIPPVGYWVIKS